MTLEILKKIRRHAAVARGDFATLIKDVRIPPLPAAVNRLIAEINRSEPNIDRLVKLISSDPEIVSRVIKTVNSSLYSPRVPVADVKRAVTLMGLAQIRSIVLAYATMDALPKPKGDLFNHNAFWIDSLLRAILARALSRPLFSGQMDEVFTASLLSELAVASGLFALWLVGWIYPQAGLSDPFALNWYRILVIALTMGVSGVIMVGVKCVHPPAAASALIAAMGFLNSMDQVLGVIGAMMLLVLEAILFNRIIGGLPYPLWRADPKIARSFGAMAGIPESETTFWRQLATKTLQRRGS